LLDQHSYTKFAAYVCLDHGGNYAAAASALYHQGDRSDRSIPQECGDQSADCEAIISRSAKLSPIAYDRSRPAEAEALGIRVGTLDLLVAAARGNGQKPAG
jgi:hypothetical protein